jgi:hypothetical protein
MAPKKDNEVLTYNGKMLLRKGNEIYYGSPDGKYMVFFKVLESKKLNDLDVATKVAIELRTNEPENSQIMRQAERDSLYKAFDIGFYWLEDALANY